MYVKTIATILFLFAIAFSPVFPQHKSEKAQPAQESVLILRDSSDLEKSVSRIIQDTLTKLGYTIKEVGLADVVWEKASSYKISILFGAINAGEEVDARVQKFIISKSDTTFKTLLFTVYGRIFNKDDQNIDAMTQASKDLHPDLIAEQILRSLRPYL